MTSKKTAFAALDAMADSYVADAPGGGGAPQREQARVSVLIDAELHAALKVHLAKQRTTMKDWLVLQIDRELGTDG